MRKTTSELLIRAWKPWRMAHLYCNWPDALLDRLHLLTSQPIVYRLRNGAKFSACARSLDVRIINEIWIDNVYTPAPLFSIRDGWTIVDVGGHKGFFSILAATSAKGVRIYVFEPSPESFAALSNNIQLNRLSNVKAFNIAVSQAEGERVLHLAAEPVCNSLLMRTDVAMRGDITVKAWSLERVLRTVGSSVDLLKMDIEGLEYEVLLSCSPQALGVVERIALEYHDKAVSGTHDVSQLSAFLNRNGFSTQLNVTRRILLAQRK